MGFERWALCTHTITDSGPLCHDNPDNKGYKVGRLLQVEGTAHRKAWRGLRDCVLEVHVPEAGER